MDKCKFFGVVNGNLYHADNNCQQKIDCHNKPLVLFIDSNVINVFNDFKITEEELPGLVFFGVINHYLDNFENINNINNNSNLRNNILADLKTAYSFIENNDYQSVYQIVINKNVTKDKLNEVLNDFFDIYKEFFKNKILNTNLINDIISNIDNKYKNYSDIYFSDIFKRFESEMNVDSDTLYPLGIRERQQTMTVLASIKYQVDKENNRLKFPLNDSNGKQILLYDINSFFLINSVNYLLFEHFKKSEKEFHLFVSEMNEFFLGPTHFIHAYTLNLYLDFKRGNDDIFDIRKNSNKNEHLKQFWPLNRQLNFNHKDFKSSFNDIAFYTYMMYVSSISFNKYHICFVSQDADTLNLFKIMQKNYNIFSQIDEKIANICKKCLEAIVMNNRGKRYLEANHSKDEILNALFDPLDLVNSAMMGIGFNDTFQLLENKLKTELFNWALSTRNDSIIVGIMRNCKKDDPNYHAKKIKIAENYLSTSIDIRKKVV